MKKYIAIIFTIAFSSIAFSQFSGGGNGQMKPPKFSAKQEAGIFYYDIDEVIEKVKIKKEEKKYKSFRALRVYNDSIKNISFLEHQTLSDLDLVVSTTMQSAMENKDFESVRNLRQNVRKVLGPIRDNVLQQEKILNDTLSKILSEKQFKRWSKYQKKQKDKLKPKSPQTNNRGNQNMMQRRGRGGMRRGF